MLGEGDAEVVEITGEKAGVETAALLEEDSGGSVAALEEAVGIETNPVAAYQLADDEQDA